MPVRLRPDRPAPALRPTSRIPRCSRERTSQALLHPAVRDPPDAGSVEYRRIRAPAAIPRRFILPQPLAALPGHPPPLRRQEPDLDHQPLVQRLAHGLPQRHLGPGDLPQASIRERIGPCCRNLLPAAKSVSIKTLVEWDKHPASATASCAALRDGTSYAATASTPRGRPGPSMFAGFKMRSAQAVAVDRGAMASVRRST